ncbi:uncharacterized protein G2W53_033368 [Senna tora]|uniref:Uncharacterized protein n=1 Tax=Senna tora TaxID=362788 RepID=A0A834W7W3_9FABA|nr:uncharacterized protein G2W53_033368 [Senna tora]
MDRSWWRGLLRDISYGDDHEKI